MQEKVNDAKWEVREREIISFVLVHNIQIRNTVVFFLSVLVHGAQLKEVFAMFSSF